MKYKIVGISGKARSGKSTLADIMEKKYGWNHVTLASILKLECRRKYGLTIDQVDGVFKESPTQYRKPDGSFYTPREILILEGRHTRTIDPDYYIKNVDTSFVADRINVIADVRFRNEADHIKQQGGYLVRLERFANLRRGDIQDVSETELDNYDKWDMVVPASWNETMTHLEITADSLADVVREHYHARII